MTAYREVRWAKKKGSESWEKVGRAGIQTEGIESQKAGRKKGKARGGKKVKRIQKEMNESSSWSLCSSHTPLVLWYYSSPQTWKYYRTSIQEALS